MWIRKYLVRGPEDGSEAGGGAAAGGGGAASADAGASATGGADAGAAAAAGAGGSGSAAAAGSSAAAGGASSGAAAAGAGAGDAGADGKGKGKETNEGYWPADWRDTVSKGDAKILARMGRYQSPAAAMDALIAAQNRISAGELKPVLGKNASADEIAAWRTEHGIPATSDKYDLGKDIKIDGMNQELLAHVFKAAHESNQTPDQLKATMQAWGAISNSVAEQRAQADAKVQKDSEDVLRAEWGPEFRRNINLVHGMLDGATTPQLKEKLLGGRLADGTPIGSSPEALKFLAGLALIQNPTGIVVPGNESNPMKGLEEEISGIEKTMRENRAAYNKDEKMQARYRDLLGAREAMKPKE